jgi:hypothetical protein
LAFVCVNFYHLNRAEQRNVQTYRILRQKPLALPLPVGFPCSVPLVSGGSIV